MITALNHINIVTARMDETVAFYGGVLGLARGWAPDFGFRVEWFYAGGQPVVHVMEIADAREGQAAVDHFAFTVSDFDGAVRRLEAHGWAYDLREVEGGAIRQANVTDPNGVRIELNWVSPDFRMEAMVKGTAATTA